MKKILAAGASLVLAVGTALAADKADVKHQPKAAIKLTDAQMATKTAGYCLITFRGPVFAASGGMQTAIAFSGGSTFNGLLNGVAHPSAYAYVGC